MLLVMKPERNNMRAKCEIDTWCSAEVIGAAVTLSQRMDAILTAMCI